ncbi:NEDD8 ultimate buster 1 isoform X1 [Bombyx mori]|uniref:UBA domain-containing protein n=1 Tax=Bombyx mori TaxID=7091 RepID=A0A8R1WH78_BOMMO|nr:NEDD8 ultimate buster 1 [Bombyx mori]
MELNLQHEDLLIKLRAKLNEEKIKLWEPPYYQADNDRSQNLRDLALKYSSQLLQDDETVFSALRELQLHSLDRSKANAEYKETGLATFRVKANVSGQKPVVLKIQKKLEVPGSDLIETVAKEISVGTDRIKLICNGKIIKPTMNLNEQNIKNGVQIMALIMGEAPENVKKENDMYMEMKSTRDDALLLTDCAEELTGDDEYLKLEDQSGKALQLPAAERRSLTVGLALHERGRAAVQQKDYTLALVLLLEADRQFSECSSNLLKSVDNIAVLQLDISWCYLHLQNLASATDVASRLQRAEASFKDTYGENHERLIALKGNAANERVLFMRLYLLQGIVAYHQNKREEARRLFDKAENEMNFLRVDDGSVAALMELGWTRSQARTGLRAAAGHVDRAHQLLEERSEERERERERHRQEREERALGRCADGSPVSAALLAGLLDMGCARRLALLALKNSNNNVAEALYLMQERRELLQDSDASSSDPETPSSDDSTLEPDNKLAAELEAMGYDLDDARIALKLSRNQLGGALDILLGGQLRDVGDPSTSSAAASKKRLRKLKREKREKRRQERDSALKRLKTSVKTEDDDYLDTSLVDEEEFLAKYKSLL